MRVLNLELLTIESLTLHFISFYNYAHHVHDMKKCKIIYVSGLMFVISFSIFEYNMRIVHLFHSLMHVDV